MHSARMVGADRARGEEAYQSAPSARPVTAGQIWRRHGGVRWAEIQADTMEPSGWRLMVPLVGPADAPYAPPLIVSVGQQRARVHLVTTAPTDELGTADGELAPEDVASLRDAIRALIREP